MFSNAHVHLPAAALLLVAVVCLGGAGGAQSGMFSGGDAYERFMGRWSRALAPLLVKFAGVGNGERVLDVGSGTGAAALWRKHGLVDVSEQALTIPTRFASFDDYWRPFLEKQGPAGDYVATLTEADRDRLRTRLRARVLGDGADRAFVLSARAWAVRGTVR